MRRAIDSLIRRQEDAAATTAAQDDGEGEDKKNECAPFKAWLLQAERRPLDLNAELPTELADCTTAGAFTAAFSTYFDGVRPDYYEGLIVDSLLEERTKDTVAAVKEHRDFILEQHAKASVVVSIVQHIPVAWRGNMLAGVGPLPQTLRGFSEWRDKLYERFEESFSDYTAKVVEWYTRNQMDDWSVSISM